MSDSSRQFTNMLASRLTVPSPYEDERMADVMTGGQKRSFETSRDVTNTLLSTMSKRRFTGDSSLAPFRSTMPDQLVRGMRVVNSGFSSTHANTDEVVTTPIFVKPFAQGWEQDYVEYTPLFCNRVEPELQSMAMHTVASPQVLNFVLELGALTQSRNALIARAGLSQNLVEMREYLEYMIPMEDSASSDPFASLTESFAEKWNYLGPMTTFQDAGIHSSNPGVRRSQGAQRMLGWSVFNRIKAFNLFSPSISKGDHMFFVCKEVDVSHLKNFVDPRGQAVVARTTFPARALQIVGFSEHDAPFPIHSTGFDPVVGPDSFNDPAAGDLDYIQSARRIAQDYRPLELDDNDNIRFLSINNDADAINESLRQTPELVYRAYMEGRATKVGVARAFEGRRPSYQAIQAAHRSHDAMKLLQLVEFYNV